MGSKLKEKGKFKDYIDIFPDNYDDFPLFFDEKMLENLEGSLFVEYVKKSKQNLKASYDQLCVYIPDFKQFTFIEFIRVM